MKNEKRMNVLLGVFLFGLVILLTNDQIKEHIPYTNVILSVIFLGLVGLALFTFLFVKKR